MERMAQIIKVKPEVIPEYKRIHAAVWPEILKAIHDSNIRNYSIFLRDGVLFASFEYVGKDFAADMKAMAADPETRRWWAPGVWGGVETGWKVHPSNTAGSD